MKPASLLKTVSPWVVGGASGVYSLVRSRRLSLASARPAKILPFLFRQTDVVALMASNQLVWYWLRRQDQRDSTAHNQRVKRQDRALFHLREVLTVQRLGLALLRRRLTRGAYQESIELISRLQRSVDDGVRAFHDLDERPHIGRLATESD